MGVKYASWLSLAAREAAALDERASRFRWTPSVRMAEMDAEVFLIWRDGLRSQTLNKTGLALRAATIEVACTPVDDSFRPTGRITIMQQAHTKAAEHHEAAAKSHRTAAEHHGKNEHAKGHDASSQAQQHSKAAHEQSETAHSKSAQQSKK